MLHWHPFMLRKRFVEILCRQEVGKRLVCKTNNSSARLNTLWHIATRWHFNDSYIFFMELYSHSTYYGSFTALDMKYSYAKAYWVQPEPLCVDSRCVAAYVSCFQYTSVQTACPTQHVFIHSFPSATVCSPVNLSYNATNSGTTMRHQTVLWRASQYSRRYSRI